MHSIVDGDVLVYKSCFATEYKIYNHPVFGKFRRKKELNGFLLANVDEDAPEYSTEVIVETMVEPLETTFEVLEGILKDIRMRTNSLHQTVYISKHPSTNFRKSINYPIPYKGGRQERPSNFLAVLAYLGRVKGGPYTVSWVDGIEVDDALGISAYADFKRSAANPSVIIATIDKDLLQIPGLHYHIDDKTIKEVSLFEADKHFYRQMLMGDRVDNVLGIDGIGPVGADKRLAACDTPAAMDEVVIYEYQKYFKGSWEAMYKANKTLLWILREPL